MTQLIECVPNFSEGRNPAVIQAIADAIRSQPVYLLDVHSDFDHHRTVMTFAGEPDVVCEAMFRAAQIAVEQIDLETHKGVHPRLGAVDVVPFVPLRSVSMDKCISLARTFGQRVAHELDVPVYLYGYAALREDRTALPDVRRGGYEALKMSIATDPSRQPDYGRTVLGSAGAMIVGARKPLIAFNVILDTADVSIARSVALAVRESGGGLKHIRALAFVVGGRAQVSVNLTDFEKTSLFALMERLQFEAQKFGAQVVESELVGLAPQVALLDCAVEYLKLPRRAREQMIEARLGELTGDYREITFR